MDDIDSRSGATNVDERMEELRRYVDENIDLLRQTDLKQHENRGIFRCTAEYGTSTRFELEQRGEIST